MENLFHDIYLLEFSRQNTSQLLVEINSLSEAALADTDGLMERMTKRYSITDIPVIDKRRIGDPKVTMEKVRFQGINFRPSSNLTRDVATVIYNIPFTGNSKFFKMYPSRPYDGRILGEAGNNVLTVKIYTEYGNEQLSDQVKNEVISKIKIICDNIENLLLNLDREAKTYNDELTNYIKKIASERLESITKAKQQSSSLNPFK